MSNDSLSLVFILIDELFGAGESDLVDELVHFIGRHTDTSVADGKGFLVLIDNNADSEVAEFALEITYRSKCFEFLRSVHGITNQLTEEDLVVGIEKFLDYGEDVV